jgi:hypothetical protein
VNDGGTVVGYYTTPQSNIGFIRYGNGSIRNVVLGSDTMPYSINESGAVTGAFMDALAIAGPVSTKVMSVGIHQFSGDTDRP